MALLCYQKQMGYQLEGQLHRRYLQSPVPELAQPQPAVVVWITQVPLRQLLAERRQVLVLWLPANGGEHESEYR